MNKFGDIIREHRKRKNMTQEELGNKLFVSKQAISKWETGRSLPDLETTKKLIEILEIDANEILGGTVQEVKKNRKLLLTFIAISIIVSALLCALVWIQYHKKATIEIRYEDLIEAGYHGEVNPVNGYATFVTMVQLLATPEKYDGKLVRVIGVGNLEFEGNFLSLSKEDYVYGASNSIWIELGERAIPYDEAKEYNGKYVIVEGIFDQYDRGHMSLFSGSIKNISRYQLWEGDDIRRPESGG